MTFSLKRALKRALLLTLAVCILWTGLRLPTAMAAEENIFIVNLTTRQIADGLIGVRARVLDSNNNGVNAAAGQFSASIDGVNVDVLSSAKGLDITSTGYIYVVDVSKYYVDSAAQISETITALLNAMMILLKDDDGVRFVWVNNTGAPDVDNYVNPSTARQMFSTADTIQNRYKANQDEAALYDGINRAVQLALDPNDPYVFHQVVVISDCFNARGTTGNATLDAIRTTIDQNSPLPIWCVALENSAAGADRKQQANTYQEAMQTFVLATGGSFYMMDYARNVLSSKDRNAAAQAQEVLTHINSLQQGNVNLVLSLNEHLGEFDRTTGRISTVTLTRDSRNATYSGNLSLNTLPDAPPSAPTASPYFAIYGETNSSNVRDLQQLLTNLGYYHGEIDGNFNNSTRLAYQALCKANEIALETTENDELCVTTKTYNMLATDNSLITASPVPTTAAPTPTPVPPFAVYGDKDSDNVRNLQERMKDLGYYNGEVNGNFDNATRLAYEALCEANKLKVTMDARGNVQVSEENYAIIATDKTLATPTPVPTTAAPTNTPEPSPTPVPPFASFGDRGSENVRDLQSLLARLGYFTEEIDGNFGASTRQAYVDLCETNSLDRETDESGVLIVSQERFSQISTDATLATATPPTPTPKPDYIDLAAGDTDTEEDTYVANLQNRLRSLNYFGDTAFTPGTYDDATVDAVQFFYDENGLGGEGIDGTSVSANVQAQFIFANDAKGYEAPDKSLSEKIRDFLARELSIGSLSIPMWVIVVICAALLLLILLLVIFIRLRSKHNDDTIMDPASDSTILPNIPPMGTGLGNDMPTAAASSTYGGNTVFGGTGLGTGADFGGGAGFGGADFGGGFNNNNTFGGFSGDEATVSGAFSGDEATVSSDETVMIPSVTLEISYNGTTNTITEQVDGLLTIGRKNCQVRIDPSDTTASRHHCDLFFDGVQLKVRNVSTSKTGTLLNGQPVVSSSSSVTGEDSPTVSFDEAFASAGADAPVNNGDVLTVGRHKITVYYQF